MKYLIIYQDRTAFYTNYYTYENCWSDETKCVVNLLEGVITFNGKTWKQIEYDNL